jgi:LacI family repressor for deo operon, udp, cdd, tsx, nupC, and nupG
MMTWVMITGRTAGARATIADVAREAGVNKGTVSRALRGSAGVGRSTRERIVQTADRLDYSASHIATALATGDSRTVGIVLPTLRSWYFSEVASGASEVLTPAGFRVELINLGVGADYLDVESAEFRNLFTALGGARGRAALLFAGTVSTEQRNAAGVARVPAALVGMPVRSVPGIFIDHRDGGRLVAQHLLQLGHRRMAVVDGRAAGTTGTTNAAVWEQRTDGFLHAVREAGLDVESGLHLFPGDCQAEDGERAMRSLLASGTPLPSAIFCHSDPLAFGVLSVLRQSGIRCPQDISVAAFDDHPMSRFWGLTTVSQHAHEQGVRAAQALVNALQRGQDRALPAWSPPAQDLTVQLVVRESTMVPRSKC